MEQTSITETRVGNHVSLFRYYLLQKLDDCSNLDRITWSTIVPVLITKSQRPYGTFFRYNVPLFYRVKNRKGLVVIQ